MDIETWFIRPSDIDLSGFLNQQKRCSWDEFQWFFNWGSYGAQESGEFGEGRGPMVNEFIKLMVCEKKNFFHAFS